MREIDPPPSKHRLLSPEVVTVPPLRLARRTLQNTAGASTHLLDFSSDLVHQFVGELRRVFTDEGLDWDLGLIFELAPLSALLDERMNDVRQTVAVAVDSDAPGPEGVQIASEPECLALRIGAVGDGPLSAVLPDVLRMAASWANPLRGLKLGDFLRTHFVPAPEGEMEIVFYIEISMISGKTTKVSSA